MYKKLRHLTEVKKGETGCGLLIENDGHITGNKDMIQQIKEDIAHHDKFVIPDKFTVNAVFQKFGIKNANGRVYPENILKREVEKYIQTRVNNRAAVGALDHPECQLPDTRILTEEGWKFITDVKKEYASDCIIRENKTILLVPGKIPKCKYMLFEALSQNLIDDFLVSHFSGITLPEDYIELLKNMQYN